MDANSNTVNYEKHSDKKSVVLLLPTKDAFKSLNLKKFNAFYILLPSSAKLYQKNLQGVAKDHLCTVLSYRNINGIRRCLDKFKKESTIDYLVVGSTEEEVLLGGKLRSEFGIDFGLKESQASIFVDKYHMKSKLLKSNPQIKTAKFMELSKDSIEKVYNTIDTFKFPILVKPKDGSASSGIKVFETNADFLTFLDQHKKEVFKNQYIIEEFIRGKVMRMDGHTYHGKLIANFPAFYDPSCLEYYQDGIANMTYSDFNHQNHYDQFAEAVLEALELSTGSFHLEAIQSDDDGELYFLEIAARIGGSSEILEMALGYSCEKAFYRSQVDEMVPFNLN